MVALTSYQTAMRTPGARQLRLFSRYKGAVAATFTVNAVPTYPATALAGTYTTGSASDVGDGFLCEIRTSGGVLRGITRTRYGATQTATSLKIRELSRGEIVVANGDVVTIRREVRLSDKLVTADANFNPDGIAVGTFNSAPPPVANSGGHRVGRVDAGQTYMSVTHTGTLSYTVDPASSGAVTHLYTLPTGAGSFAPGSLSTDASPTVRYNVNADGWLVKHAVTDSTNSKTTTEYIMVIVHDDNNPPYDCITQPMAGTTENGWGYDVELFEDLSETALPYGSYTFLWREGAMGGGQTFVGSPVSGVSHIAHVGILRREESTSEGGYETIRFTVISPLARLAETPGFSKVMIREASPDAWAEISNLTVKRAITQLILFYVNFVEAGFNFIIHANYTAYDYPLLFCNKDNPLGQIRELARATKGRFVCDRRGRFELQPVMNLLDTTTRTAQTTILSVTRADILGYTVSQEHWRPIETFYLKGFVAHATDPTPVFAKWPGAAPGQGAQTDSAERIITLNASTAYAECGLYGAIADGWFVDTNLAGHFAPKVTLRFPLSFDAFDFYVGYILLPFSLRLRGLDLSAFRYEITNISVDYSNGDGEVVLELQAETFGQPGVDDTPDQSNTGDLTAPPWGTISFDIFAPLYQLTASTVRLAIFMFRDESADAASLFIPNAAGTTFTETTLASLGLTGRYVRAVVDPFSPRYLTGSGAVNGWILSNTQVRRITDVDGTPALGTAYGLGLTGGDVVTFLCIHTHIAAQNFVVVSFNLTNAGTPSRDGHYIARTTDGTNWSVAKLSTNVTGDAIWVSAHQAGYVLAQDAVTVSGRILYRILKSTDYGATFSVLYSFPDPGGGAFDYRIRGIHVPYHNNADDGIFYFTRREAGSGAGTGMYQFDHGVVTDITEVTGGGARCSFYGMTGMDSSVFNRDVLRAIVLRLYLFPGGFEYGDYTQSDDAGANWSPNTVSQTDLFSMAMAGDNPDVQWRWGQNGLLEQTLNDGGAWSDVSGDLPGSGAADGDNTIDVIWGL